MKIFTLFYKLSLLLFCLGSLSLYPSQLAAQSYQLPLQGTATYSTCSGTLYDDGGPNGNYSSNGEGVVTLTPGTAGSKVKLAFSLLELDSMRTNVLVHDGPTIYDPLIEQLQKGHPTVYATNSTGALTVQFLGWGGQPKRGFAATISCVQRVPLPDLTVQCQALSPNRLPATRDFTATIRVTNLEGNPTRTGISYYLSTDNSFSTNDVFLKSDLFAPLVAGVNATYSRQFTVPAGTEPGSYYLICIIDPDQSTTESDETNNVAYAPLTVQEPMADLVVSNFYLYDKVLPGSSIGVNYNVSNQGTTASSPTTVGYYLSTDNVLSASDVLVGEESVGATAAGSNTQVTGGLALPPSTALGTYYLFIVADYLHQEPEIDEGNNYNSAKLNIVAPGVDLAFTYPAPFLYPYQGAIGDTTHVRCWIENRGSISADSVPMGYYLSTDSIFSANDVLLGHELVTGDFGPIILRAGEVSVAGGNVVIPPGTLPGKYYVLLVIDYGNRFAETDETNNVAYAALEVVVPNIDLTINPPSTPSITEAVGNPVGILTTLANKGTTVAIHPKVGCYLSRDKVLSADDVFIGLAGHFSLSEIYGKSTKSDFYSATMPAGTVPGTYYVLQVADYLNQLAETDESNNISYVTVRLIKPNPDLALEYAPTISPATSPAGSVITTTCNLKNLGTTTVNEPTLGHYLSKDNVLSANDVLLGHTTAYSMSGGFGYDLTSSLTIPLTTVPGKYYVLFVADYLNQCAEITETNNLKATALEVTPAYPDLKMTPTPYVSPTQTVAGAKVDMLSFVYNIGYGIAKPFKVGYYLSTDKVFSTNDLLIGSGTAGEVYPTYSAYVTGTGTIPASTPSGRYYVLFVSDYLNEQIDSDRTNNSSYASLLIDTPGTDLVIQAPTVTPTFVAAGGTVLASGTVYNAGREAASSSAVGFYLSADAAFDTDDMLLATTPGGPLAAITGTPLTATLTIPAATASGNYYLLLVADPANLVSETVESNNVAYLALTVAEPLVGTVVPTSGNRTITACSGKVYDNGGVGNYPNDADGTLTINPGTTGAHISLLFNSFYTEKTLDYLLVYDGPNTSAPLLGTYSGTSSDGQVPGIVTASSRNTSGALTLRFVSNGSTPATGFEATISCAQPLAAREQTAGYELRILPVPVASPTPLQVQLSGHGTRGSATVALYTSLGQLAASQELALVPSRTNQAIFQTAGLATGVYVLRITGSDLNATRRVVIE